jgi:hypothetical protein
MSDDLRALATAARIQLDQPENRTDIAADEILYQYLRAAVEAEREACAQIADSFRCGCCGMDDKAAAAMRARKP